LVSLIFILVPGTQGANRFGAPPPPNNRSITVVLVLLLLVVVIGILAAIALPAYQGYVKRARAAQPSSSSWVQPQNTASLKSFTPVS
jgi:uncharacterized membrane protein YhaH (DUF805 family)